MRHTVDLTPEQVELVAQNIVSDLKRKAAKQHLPVKHYVARAFDIKHNDQNPN